jgi:D-proline reductase (dithiol) PrdB
MRALKDFSTLSSEISGFFQKSQHQPEEPMEQSEKIVDGFRFLPPSLKAWVQTFIPEGEFKGSIPWTPMSKPLSQTTLALVTSAGISLKSDPPFDMEREKREPIWGDRSFRTIPRETTEEDIEVNHLHINTTYVKRDINVMLPLARMAEFERERVIGRLAPTAYSFYGFQWQNTDFLKEAIEPISKRMKVEGVEAVLLTPA